MSAPSSSHNETLDKLEAGILSTLDLVADLLSQLSEIRTSTDAEQQRLISKCAQILDTLKLIQEDAASLAPLEQEVAFHRGRAYVERRIVQLVEEAGPPVMAALTADTERLRAEVGGMK